MSATARANDTTVRIDRKTSSTLDRLARERGEGKKDLIARAVENMRRDEMLDAINAGYAAMRRDETAWREEQSERNLWESASNDGLTDE